MSERDWLEEFREAHADVVRTAGTTDVYVSLEYLARAAERHGPALIAAARRERELAQEVEALTAEADRWRKDSSEMCRQRDEARIERDEFAQKIERLVEDNNYFAGQTSKLRAVADAAASALQVQELCRHWHFGTLTEALRAAGYEV